jgi:hypothetical protein
MTDSPDAGNDHKRIAFLDLASFEEGEAIRGGCLVTDEHTRPLEFRVSGSIRPTSLQKMLYGDTLHEYICTDLLGEPILAALEGEPDFVLVRDAEFLKIRPDVVFPILWVRGTVDGQFVLQAFPGYDEEAESARDLLPKRLRGRRILEPFMRIKNALEEAHDRQVGEAKAS